MPTFSALLVIIHLLGLFPELISDFCSGLDLGVLLVWWLVLKGHLNVPMCGS